MSAKKKSLNYKKYRAVIIGAGRIGAQFDTPKSRAVLTHAHAYSKNPAVELVGIYDIDSVAAQKAAKCWSTKAFSDIKSLFKSTQPDIVSICTPDATHYGMLRMVAKYNPRLVIVEKPVTTRVADTKKIIALYKKENIPVLVNYSRRFDSSMQELSKEINAGDHGKVLGAVGIYTKGILHNGSHLIDLARYFFGEVARTAAQYGRKDYAGNDLTVGGFLTLQKCPQFYIVSADERAYTIFELDILCERSRLRITDSGFSMSVQATIADPLFAGYTILSHPQEKQTKLSTAVAGLVENAVAHLEAAEPLRSTLEDALKTQEVCSALLSNYKK